jgi:hypothetical protein
MSTKGWGKAAPRSLRERRDLLERCGEKAFLDPARLRFPVMSKRGACVVDCRGVAAAKQRAAQYHHPKVKKKAAALRSRCTVR